MNLKSWHRHFLTSLKSIYEEGEASAITDLIFEDCFKIKKSDIIKNGEIELSNKEGSEWQSALDRLMQGEPVQYVTGSTVFAGYRFAVGDGILIPRPETEMLVKIALQDISSHSSINVLDVGTGSGCIGISIKKKREHAEVHVCDISEKAIGWVKKNAEKLSADIHIHQIDFLDKENRDTLPVFDLIISNPPYIPLQEISTLEKNVRDFEPKLALFVPDDRPLIFYEALADFSISHLRKNGVIWMETHCHYAQNVKWLFEKKGYTCLLMQDEFGKERYVRATTQNR